MGNVGESLARYSPCAVRGIQVQPGSLSTEIVATYDIFVTMVSLAGATLPSNRIYDGIDISPVFTGVSGAKGHDCVFNYQTGKQLAVVRCGKYKVRAVSLVQPLQQALTARECSVWGQ